MSNAPPTARTGRPATRSPDGSPGTDASANQGLTPMSAAPALVHAASVHHYLLYHRHASADCAAVFAAWDGFDSDLRGRDALSSCAFGAHEIWWQVDATDVSDALTPLPPFVARRTLVIRVAPLTIA